LFGDISKASGYEGARVTDRNMNMSLDPDMVVLSDLDLYSSQINNSTGALSLTIGGNPQIVLSAPAMQIVESKPGARENHVTNELKVEFKRSTYGNDEFQILQGVFS